jgi:hypothetical protein
MPVDIRILRANRTVMSYIVKSSRSVMDDLAASCLEIRAKFSPPGVGYVIFGVSCPCRQLLPCDRDGCRCIEVSFESFLLPLSQG